MSKQQASPSAGRSKSHTLEARKANDLAHRWPLLAPGTDLEGLPARVAFNLHRLGTTKVQLQDGGLSRRLAEDVLHGRVEIEEQLIAHLATALGVQLQDLTATLPPQVKLSLTHPTFRTPDLLWLRILSNPTLKALSDKDLSTILGIDYRRIGDARRGHPTRALSWDELNRVADYLGSDILAVLNDPSTER